MISLLSNDPLKTIFKTRHLVFFMLLSSPYLTCVTDHLLHLNRIQVFFWWHIKTHLGVLILHQMSDHLILPIIKHMSCDGNTACNLARERLEDKCSEYSLCASKFPYSWGNKIHLSENVIPFLSLFHFQDENENKKVDRIIVSEYMQHNIF